MINRAGKGSDSWVGKARLTARQSGRRKSVVHRGSIAHHVREPSRPVLPVRSGRLSHPRWPEPGPHNLIRRRTLFHFSRK